jgi:hypothetical protein
MTLHGGSVFRMTELGPGFTTPMHRTLLIDYCMVLSGELELILDGGEKIKLLAWRDLGATRYKPRLAQSQPSGKIVIRTGRYG